MAFKGLKGDRMKKIAKQILKDKYGQIYSIELLLSIILLLVIVSTMLHINDMMNEKILSQEESSALEDMAIESADYLLNNPGNPEDWEDDKGLKKGIVSRNIIPGLAIKDKYVENGFFRDESSESEEVILNTISYIKLMRLKNNYDDLINRNLFNSSLKSSISIYPIDSNMESISMGDELEGDVATVERRVRCDYFSSFVLYRFNDFELYGDDYIKAEKCNHDTNPNLTNHSSDGRSFWLCKNFRVYRSSLENYDYYLISDSSIRHANSYYILESLNRSSEDKKRLDDETIGLNSFFMEDMENSSNEIYSIHFNVEKSKINDFKTVLVSIPKNMSEDIISNNQLKYDYFNSREVDFVFKASYK